MNEIKPDDPRGGPRHVDSRILSDAPVLQENLVPMLHGPPDTELDPERSADPIPPPTGEELLAAKYYALAFLLVVIPLGLLLLGLLVVAFVRSLEFMR